MTEKEKELIISYFINYEFSIEDQLTELRNRIRFRKIGIEDNVEMMLLMQRLADFKEFRSDVIRLLNLF